MLSVFALWPCIVLVAVLHSLFKNDEGQAWAAQPEDSASAEAEGRVGRATRGGGAAEEGRDAQQGRAASDAAGVGPPLSCACHLADPAAGVEPTDGALLQCLE